MAERMPWDKWSWDAWETDPGLALCSMGAQGFWMRLLCIAAKSDGFVLIGGKRPKPELLATLTRQSAENVRAWIAELTAHGVCSLTQGRVIYSRRMREERERSERNRKNGSLGGNPSLRKQTENSPEDAIFDDRSDKAEEEKNKIKNIVVGQEADPSALVSTAVGLWNLTAKQCDLPEVRKLDDSRRKRLVKILAEGGLDDWRQALASVERSRLCRGLVPGRNGAAPWRCNFDFLTSPSGYRKVLEGNYSPDIDPPAAVPSGQPESPDEMWRRRLSEFRSQFYWGDDWGPKPGRPGCLAPPEILDEHAIVGRQAA